MTAAVQRFLVLASGRTDVVLAFFITAIIFMMILPLPTILIDFLIASNMGLAMTLLMVGIYLSSPLQFAAFPSVLLITTLFRLALSISTTRLILLQADAGEIVFAFGNFVVGGNLVVGMVIFLILTIVQFIVVTKGAERVAEVSARFSLDAMPGKQLSIDSDMRAGLIDIEEARKRRFMLEKESQLFGSMDGAMKFVKGDAIAGIIIVAVNLLGGITIGIVQRGLSASEAAHTYSILTIGDGLIGQIPALFIAITAGVIVTRVTGENSRDLGSDIIGQITHQPKALMVASCLLLAFGLVPGFPTAVFVTLAAALGVPLYLRHRRKTLQQGKGDPLRDSDDVMRGDTEKKTHTRLEDEQAFVATTPLLIEVHEDLKHSLDTAKLNDSLVKVRRALYMDLGVPFPGIRLRFSGSGQIEENSYVILLSEVPVTKGWLYPNRLLMRESESSLEMLSIPFTKGRAFLPHLETVWVDAQHKEAVQKAGLSFMEAPEVMIYHLSFVLRRHGERFIGIQEAQFVLGHMEEHFPDLVKEVQRILPLQKMADILRRLVSEDISIRDMRTVLEALVEWGQKEKDSVLLTEYVRTALGRQISYQFAGGQNMLPSYLLSSQIEDEVRGAIRQTSSGSYLALSPERSFEIVQAVQDEVAAHHSMEGTRPVLVTATDIRRYVRKLIESELYELPVLSYQELSSDMTVQPLAKINFGARGAQSLEQEAA